MKGSGGLREVLRGTELDTMKIKTEEEEEEEVHEEKEEG